MGKFRQLSTDLWPLIDVRNSFSLYIFSIFADFLQTLHESCYWEGVFWDCSSFDLRVMALD